MYDQLKEKTFARGIKVNEVNEINEVNEVNEINHDLSAAFRRFFECSTAFVLLVLLSPILLICAFLVWISSPGAILFRQKRVGRDGKIFALYKFRTMFISSGGLPITAENDSRITTIGKYLRASKVDELPQFYNIFRGEMSFVGPRPELAELVDFNCPLWRKVLKVRPGLTDPITIQFRNESLLLSRVEDKQTFYREVIQPYKLKGYVEYIENKSLQNDIKIVAQTVQVILFPHAAPPISLTEIRFDSINTDYVTVKVK